MGLMLVGNMTLKVLMLVEHILKQEMMHLQLKNFQEYLQCFH